MYEKISATDDWIVLFLFMFVLFCYTYHHLIWNNILQESLVWPFDDMLHHGLMLIFCCRNTKRGNSRERWKWWSCYEWVLTCTQHSECFGSSSTGTISSNAGWPQTWNTQGFLWTWKTQGNSVQPQGKIVTNKVFLVRHSNICVKQLLTWWPGSLRTETRPECGSDLLYCCS